jgi:hypothetical protein
VPKGHPLKEIGLEASESSPFRSAVTFVAKTRAAAGCRCLAIPSLFEWMGEEHPYPFRSQMAKVERRETVRKARLRRPTWFKVEALTR